MKRHVIPTRRSRRARLAELLAGLSRPLLLYPVALALCGLAAVCITLKGGAL
jgi:hypothetical protein